MPGKCPKCDAVVSSLKLDAVDATFASGSGFKAVILCCPKCNVILGTQIDPIAVRTDTVNMTAREVFKLLRHS